LLKQLGGHALALELAGAYLGEYPDTTPGGYLEMLEKDPTVESRVSDLVRYEKTVDAALEATWERLDEATQAAWQIAGCFESEFASAALADATTIDAEARRRLRTFHLIEVDPSGRWRMHRLVRGFGRRRGTTEAGRAAAAVFVQGCLERIRTVDIHTGFRVYLRTLQPGRGARGSR
jgi:hypothetical protein